MDEKHSIIIVGASANREKYGNKAVRAYTKAGWKVYPVNPNENIIEGLKVYPVIKDIPVSVSTASLYVPASVGEDLLDELAAKGVKEIYANPGSESDELLAKIDALGMKSIQACSIRAIGEEAELF